MENIYPNKKFAKLLAAAKKAQGFAYAPYSRYKVGAAVLTSRGKIFTGCNVENASYGLTICAERIAIGKAVSEGGKDIKAIAVFASSGHPVPPCGACRQVILEFGKDISVIMGSKNGKVAVEKISYLVPMGFESSYLKNHV